MIRADSLSGMRSVRHAFFTREGGVSGGIYASLNCGLGSGDDPSRVRENRGRAMRRLGLSAAALATARQVHSADVATIEGPWPDAERPELDAMVTGTPGVALGILTADCAPVLFADADAGVIGAAHAGWRGAKGGIVETTVLAMVELGARRERIDAAVGPCIRRESYEVGPEFRAAFVADDPSTAALFHPNGDDGRVCFDLAGYVALRLRASGVRTAEVLPHDTFAEEERFFSYRRVTIAGGGDYGRMLSAIALAP